MNVLVVDAGQRYKDSLRFNLNDRAYLAYRIIRALIDSSCHRSNVTEIAWNVLPVATLLPCLLTSLKLQASANAVWSSMRSRQSSLLISMNIESRGTATFFRVVERGMSVEGGLWLEGDLQSALCRLSEAGASDRASI